MDESLELLGVFWFRYGENLVEIEINMEERIKG